MTRPFTSLGIHELETRFGAATVGNDREMLESLNYELGFRSTRRARDLGAKIEAALSNLNSTAIGPSPLVPIETPEFVPTDRDEATLLSPRTTRPVEESEKELPPPKRPSRSDVRRPPAATRPSSAPDAPKALDARSAANVISSWIALEVLSPQTYRFPADLVDGERRRVADIKDAGPLPWERGERSIPNYQLFYHVVLGSIKMEPATSKLLNVFEDDDQDRSASTGFAAIAIITVDRHGRPVEPEATATSSFAWGLPIALRGDLTSLGLWSETERTLNRELDKFVRREDSDGAVLPVDRKMILDAYHWVVGALNLPPELVDAPSFALRVYHYFRAEEPPDPPPLGSFFLGDLARAKSAVLAGNAPELLKRYLGINMPARRRDLLSDDALLASTVAPETFSSGRWPAVGSKPLVLLQQAAVNLATSSSEETRLMAVNGPPGTGKTTILRDLVSAIVVARARVMIGFDAPATAFERTTVKQIYKIDPRLKGFEIIVASSNNKAVENVSAELPMLDAIDRRWGEKHGYLSTISDRILRGNPEADAAAEHDAPPAPRRTWGLIAAVLGNARNRSAFYRAAWKDEDFGLKSYLLAASGDSPTIEIKDPKTGRILGNRKPKVIEAEKPPTTEAAALREWQRARRAFKEIAAQVDGRLATLETGRASLNPSPMESEYGRAQAALQRVHQDNEQVHVREVTAQNLAVAARQRVVGIVASLERHRAARPSLLARITGSGTEWQLQLDALELAAKHARAEHEGKSREAEKAQAKSRESAKELNQAREKESDLRAKLTAQGEAGKRAETLAGDRFVDAAFFNRDRNDLHRDSPWLDDETQSLREQLFAAAIDVHRAFVGAAAKPIRNNLDSLFRAFFGKAAWNAALNPLMPDLWATFFSVVPVVSTTFASVERMLGYLGDESIGWLLIDEAGQSAPQAAVGAISRAKRAVVVGDPFQLPPVTTLPTELASKIADKFGVDELRFIAPTASVQALADSCSPLGTSVGTETPTWVGVPLVVHRRCAEPMFSLSNHMAYDGLMVQGRGEKHSLTRDILGPSHWIDVKPGRCEDKWSEDEGEALLNLLEKLDSGGVPNPDLYVISPFRIVTYRLREKLERSSVLRRWTENPGRWVKERVGTVYTVQGRQAETVILVLGAAQPERRRAREWAGQPSNQLNVAITRAQENIYVIGNRFEWASAGFFANLERKLP